MAALSAQALLKQRILMSIGRTPVRSATTLAQELGSPRPSTSRALHALKREGLAEYHERTWRLTYAGQVEVARLNAHLAQKVERTGLSVDRLKQLVAASADADVRVTAAKFNAFADVARGPLTTQYTDAIGAIGATTALSNVAADVMRQHIDMLGTMHATTALPNVLADVVRQLAGPPAVVPDRLLAALRAQNDIASTLSAITGATSSALTGATSVSRAYEVLKGVGGYDSSIFDMTTRFESKVAQAVSALARPASLQEMAAAHRVGGFAAPFAVQNVVSDMVNAIAPPSPVRDLIAQLTEPWTFTEQLTARTAIVDFFADVQAATAQVQMTNLAWLQGTLNDGPDTQIRGMLNTANLALSHLTADLDVVRSAPYTPQWAAMVPDLITVPGTYAAYYATSMERFARTYAQEPLPPARVDRTLVIPTTTTAQLVGTARLLIEGEGGASSIKDEPSTRAQLAERAHLVYGERMLTVELAKRLSAIAERFGRQWEGSWHELYTSGPNRHQLAAHSARELLHQLLEYLAPNNTFTPEEIKKFGNADGRATYKMQIRRFLGLALDNTSSTMKFIDAICSAYIILSGQAHLGENKLRHNDTVLSGLVAIVGGLILVILGQQEDDSW